MKNYAKQAQLYFAIVLVFVFSGIFYFIYSYGYDPKYHIYMAGELIVAFTALFGGSMAGLIASIFSVFLYGATFFYTTVMSGGYIDITYVQGLWFILYPFTALVIGKIGDGLNVYTRLHGKHPQEMKDMMQEFVFGVGSQKAFNSQIGDEIARAGRMQGHCSVAAVAIYDISEITRVFGENGIYKAMEKIKFFLRSIFRETDRITKINNTTYELLFGGMNKDMVAQRVVHLARQLENTYLDHKGTTIKFPIRISAGIAVFPEDGTDAKALKEKAEKNLTLVTY